MIGRIRADVRQGFQIPALCCIRDDAAKVAKVSKPPVHIRGSVAAHVQESIPYRIGAKNPVVNDFTRTARRLAASEPSRSGSPAADPAALVLHA